MIDIISKRKLFFTFSGILIAIALLVSLVFGVRLDMQFTGGAVITFSYEGDVSTDDVASILSDEFAQQVTVISSENFVTNTPNINISFASGDNFDNTTLTTIQDVLVESYPDANLELISSNSVEASMGQEFFFKCLSALALASVLMIIYISIRFRKIGGLSAGVMAVVALLHDIIMVYATFVIFRIPLNDNFIAVVLTIIGYSINDTIVIYDRIRENNLLFGKKMSLREKVNRSINQSLKRTINTTVTTVIAMAVVGIVCVIFNVDSILSFAFPMIVGMLSGVYSTICIAGPLWVLWNEKKAAKQTTK